MKIAGIIQARTGSSRFPNKILFKIKNKTLLELYIERVMQCKLLDEIIVATTTNKNDDVIVDLIKSIYENKIKLFRGSEEDVLSRYYLCAKKFKADVICRLTSDDMFPDSDIIDRAIIIMLENRDADFVCNHLFPTYAEGLDVECYRFKVLEKCWQEAKLKSEREHVFPYIVNNKNLFKIINFTQEKDYSYLRWTVDYKCDLDMMRIIYKYLYKENEIFKQNDIMNLLKEYPNISDINKHIKRKEGVNKSIIADGGVPL